MIRPCAALLPAALALFAAPLAAEPRNWRIDAGSSRIGIVFLIDGEPRRGEIGRFSGEARFDADDPGAAELELLIDMDSVDVGEPFGTAILKNVDWFDVAEYPAARYVLARMEPIGEGRFRAIGLLTMRGAEHEVSGELDVMVSSDEATATGGAEFARSLYGVGVGFTALFVEVGDLVSVELDLTARPVE